MKKQKEEDGRLSIRLFYQGILSGCLTYAPQKGRKPGIISSGINRYLRGICTADSGQGRPVQYSTL